MPTNFQALDKPLRTLNGKRKYSLLSISPQYFERGKEINDLNSV